MNRDQSLARGVLTAAAATDREKRYEHRRRLWLDGPYGASVAFDKVMEREVGLYIAYRFSDIPAFIRHAKLRGRLRHPHLLPVLDFGRTLDNMPYFTEPCVDAVPLAQLFLHYGGHSYVSLLRLVLALTGLCQTVAYAHEKGLCHLDLTPHQVLADCASGDLFLTGGWEEVAGSPAAAVQRHFGHCYSPTFAAPEQFQASPQQLVQQGLGRLVDVYGLGSIIYYALYDAASNQVPSEANTSAGLVQALMSGQRVRPTRPLRPGLEASVEAVRGLERITLKALEPEPRHRYQAVKEIVQELQEWVEGSRNDL